MAELFEAGQVLDGGTNTILEEGSVLGEKEPSNLFEAGQQLEVGSASFTPEFEFAGEAPTSVEQFAEARTGSASAVWQQAFDEGVLGFMMNDKTDEERANIAQSAGAFAQSEGILTTIAVGAIPGIISDGPIEIASLALTGGGANVLNRIRQASKLSLRATKALAKAERGLSLANMALKGNAGRGIIGRSATEFGAGALVAAVSEATQVGLGKEFDPELFTQRMVAEGIGQSVLSGIMRGGAKAVGVAFDARPDFYKKELMDAGATDKEASIIAKQIHVEDSGRATQRLSPDQAQAKVNGEDSNLAAITKATDEGKKATLITEKMGEVEVLPTRTDMGVVRNSVQDALRESGIDMHFVRPLGESSTDGITIGKQVFIDEAVNDADFARLTGHELLHTAINKMDPDGQRVVLDKMRDIADRSDIDTANLTNEQLIEEFFAVGAGRRGQVIIDELTTELSKTPSGQNSLAQFYDQVREFVAKLGEKVKFYTVGKVSKEVDDYAEELVRNTIGSGDLSVKVDSADVKASEKLDQPEVNPKTASLESKTDQEEMAQVLAPTPDAHTAPLLDEDIPEVSGKAYGKVVEEHKKSKVDVETNVVDLDSMGKERGKVEDALFGAQSLGQQVITNIRTIGLKSLADALDRGNIKESIIGNHIHDGRKVTYEQEGITPEVLADQNSTDIRTFDIAGKQVPLTQANYTRLIAGTRSQNARGKSKGSDLGVDKNEFGMTSWAHNLSTGGFLDANGKRVKLSADDVRFIADQEYAFENVIRAAQKDYRTSGNNADWASVQQGGRRITDASDTEYLPKHIVEQGLATEGRLTDFDNGDSGTWVARQANEQPIDLQDKRPSILSESSRMADNSAKMLGYETTVKQAKAGIFKSGDMETGMFANEFLVSDAAPQNAKNAYEVELKKSGNETKAIEAGMKEAKRFGYSGKKMPDDSIAVSQAVPDLNELMNAKLGEKSSKKIQKRIDATIETTRTDDILGFWASMAMRMKRISTLGLNTTPIIQVFSVPYAGIRAASRIGGKAADNFKPGEMMASLKDMATDKGLRAETEAKAMEFIPMYKNRIDSGNVNQEFAELGSGTKEKSQLKEKFKELKATQGMSGKFKAFLSLSEESLVPISKVDRIAILSEVNQIFKAAKDLGLEEGSEKWAVEVNKMFSEVLTTQPTSWSAFKNTPQLSQGPVVRTLSMFTGATGPIFGMAQEAYTRALMGDMTMAKELLPSLMISIAGVAAVGVGAGEAKKALFQTEKDRAAIEKKFGGPASEFVTRAIGSTIGTVPIFGQFASGAASQVLTGNSFDAQVPLLQMGNDAVKAVGKMSDFEVGQATYLFLKNTTPYAVSRGFRRLTKEVEGE